ncbi:MAG: PilN domain-containing protein [Pseudoxanthomonas sp.]|nr:PilN domain-containing protein [Pseudoxanthomonas sp.]
MTSTRTPAMFNPFGHRYAVGLGTFLRWWKEELLRWVPLRWREFLGLSQDRLLLSRAGDQWRLQWQHATGVSEVAVLPMPLEAGALDAVLGRRLLGLPRWLLLPADGVLRRRIQLPAAAAERLRDVVGFEVDRLTPFTADAVRFDARVLEHRSDGQLDTELVVVPRAPFEQAVAALGEMSASLAGVDAVDAADQPLGVNLLPLALRRREINPERRWNLILAGIALLAMAAAAWQLLHNRRQAASDFTVQVEQRAPQAREVSVQRQRLQDMVEGAAFLQSARARRPTTFEVIDELSRRLPNNTYLEKLSITGDRLLMTGFSPEPSALVAKLEGSALLKSPALSGPLQPDLRAGMDRFSITAELAPAAPAAAGAADATGNR